MAHFIRVIDSMTTYQRGSLSRAAVVFVDIVVVRPLCQRREHLEGAFFIQLTHSEIPATQKTAHKRAKKNEGGQKRTDLAWLYIYSYIY